MERREVVKPLDKPDLAFPRSNYKWTDEQNALLRIMFDSGATGGHIAAAINHQTGSVYTWAAVMSHANSLGLRRPGRTTPLDWSADQNTELLKRIDATENLSQIAKAMNRSYGAVVNQVHRLGIKIPRGPRRTEVAAAFHRALMKDRKVACEHRKRLDQLLNFVPGEYRQEAPLKLAPDVVADPLNLTLSEVGRIQCRWITNDDLTAPLFCGHVAMASKSWCAKHHAVVTL